MIPMYIILVHYKSAQKEHVVRSAVWCLCARVCSMTAAAPAVPVATQEVAKAEGVESAQGLARLA